MVDQGEPSEFKSLFKGWKEKDQTVGFGKKHTSECPITSYCPTVHVLQIVPVAAAAAYD